MLLAGISANRSVLALAGLLALAAAFIDVALIPPRVTVRWGEEGSRVERMALERRYRLESGQPTEGTTWRYELLDRSRDNVRAIVTDPAVNDTGYIVV
jgi:hypothetical protein